MERLFNIEELSKILGITKATIYSWTSKNKIPYIKLSKRLLKFRESDILKWIAERSTYPNMSKIPKNYQHTTIMRNRHRNKPQKSIKLSSLHTGLC
ncbi:MAG: helix-turn-helix transcriptional regulator [Thermodesulfovibrionales bacterium]